MQPLGTTRTTHDRRLVTGRWVWERRILQYCFFFALQLSMIMAILIVAGTQNRRGWDNSAVYAVYLVALISIAAGAWRLWQTRPRGQADGG